jgi:hypothetical protein
MTLENENDLTDLYDDLTLELERAGILSQHVQERLWKICERLIGSPDTSAHDELYALEIIMGTIREKHKLIEVHARALLDGAESTATRS